MINLDFLCMKKAQEMMNCSGNPNDKENMATKGLGVLLENGPYGLMLYLESQRSNAVAGCYVKELLALCREDLISSYLCRDVPSDGRFQGITEWLRGLAQDLDSYLFTKRLWQQTLTYARYHAKALDEEASIEEREKGEDTQ